MKVLAQIAGVIRRQGLATVQLDITAGGPTESKTLLTWAGAHVVDGALIELSPDPRFLGWSENDAAATIRALQTLARQLGINPDMHPSNIAQALYDRARQVDGGSGG